MNNIEAFFKPRNIAIVGASANPKKAGNVILRNLLAVKYPHQIFPINNRSEEILGLKCYDNLSDIKDQIELVILITPSNLIDVIMADLEKRMETQNDVRAIVCAAANYGETKTEEGIRRENVLIETSRKYGIRVIGPNCIGVIDYVNRLDTTFVETSLKEDQVGRKSGVSFISQSGAMAASLLMWGASRPEPMGFNKFVSIGNMADVDFIDLLTYLEEDKDTSVIGLYLEGYEKSRLLVETLKRINLKKPVVVLKVGSSEIGAQAANSHTGSIAGSDVLYDSAFKQYGIVRVETMEEMLDTLNAFDCMTLPKNSGTYILTQAGGPGIYCTDAVSESKHLNLVDLGQAENERLKSILPEMANVGSPMGYSDITAAADVDHHINSLELISKDNEISNVLFVTVIPTFLDQIALAHKLVDQIKKLPVGKLVYTTIMAGEYVREARRILEMESIPTFNSPLDAVRVASNLNNYSEFLRRSVKGGIAYE